MSGRHKASHSKPSGKFPPAAKYGALAVVAILLIGVAVFAISRATSGCGDVPEYTVAADPAIAPAVEKVVADTDESDLGCAAFTVAATKFGDLKPDGPDAPDLWIPDSTMLLGDDADVVRESVAATPIVVAGPQSRPTTVGTWLDVLKTPNITLGDPDSDGAALAPVAAATVEAEVSASDPKEVSSALVTVAQQSSNAAASDTAKRLDTVRNNGGLAIVTEQQFTASPEAGSAEELSASVPGTGSIFLDYPLVATGSEDRDAARDAGTKLADTLASRTGSDALAARGFRGADRKSLSDGRGVDPVVALRTPDAAIVADIRSKYQSLMKPSRILVVEDVSGSMSYNAADTTRMAMTVRASEAGSKLFPQAAQVGLWSFSTGDDSTSPDYKELVPMARMDEMVDGATHRERLLAGIRSLPNGIGGGTGLYDTTLAAFREVKKGYDPNSVNSVVILTDGTNEDPGSIGLSELLSTLRSEQDPANPVKIVTIGISEDADADVLRQISEATGGTSHLSRDPSSISTVFADALQSLGN